MFPSWGTGLVPRCICLRTSSVSARKVLRKREGERDRDKEGEREGDTEGEREIETQRAREEDTLGEREREREREGERGKEKVNLEMRHTGIARNKMETREI